MSLHRTARFLKVASWYTPPIHLRQRRWHSVDAASLPLAGIKVLDMTRVLAGVSCSETTPSGAQWLTCCTALLHPNPGRPRVGIVDAVRPSPGLSAFAQRFADLPVAVPRLSRLSIRLEETTPGRGARLMLRIPQVAGRRVPAKARTSWL